MSKAKMAGKSVVEGGLPSMVWAGPDVVNAKFGAVPEPKGVALGQRATNETTVPVGT